LLGLLSAAEVRSPLMHRPIMVLVNFSCPALVRHFLTSEHGRTNKYVQSQGKRSEWHKSCLAFDRYVPTPGPIFCCLSTSAMSFPECPVETVANQQQN
jgi:hypothetical protein